MTGTLVNGRPATTVEVADRGFQYGDGLFETIAVRHGSLLLWDLHLDRLSRGCVRLGIPIPSGEVLLREARQLLTHRDRGVLKIVITRGPGGRGYGPPATGEPTRVIQCLDWPNYPDEYARDGVAVRWCATRLARQPRLAGLKHLNRLEQVLARGEWTGPEPEGLMRDAGGYVIEGTMSNVFAVVRGTLLTPDLSECGVSGVVRSKVIELAQHARMEVTVTPIPAETLEQADELFLTNSLIGLWPIRSLADRSFPIGAVTQQIRAALASAGALALAP